MTFKIIAHEALRWILGVGWSMVLETVSTVVLCMKQNCSSKKGIAFYNA